MFKFGLKIGVNWSKYWCFHKIYDFFISNLYYCHTYFFFDQHTSISNPSFFTVTAVLQGWWCYNFHCEWTNIWWNGYVLTKSWIFCYELTRITLHITISWEVESRFQYKFFCDKSCIWMMITWQFFWKHVDIQWPKLSILFSSYAPCIYSQNLQHCPNSIYNQCTQLSHKFLCNLLQ